MFRFTALDEGRHVVTNLAGEYVVLDKLDVHKFANHGLGEDSKTYRTLRAKHFLIGDKMPVARELLEIKIRTQNSKRADFTGPHIFVVTLRCEHNCPCCQVSRQSDDKLAYDIRYC
ncbi:MAG: hypothetical protein ACYYK0_04500 [Candidatus Eutrophobiaceae bacterium]